MTTTASVCPKCTIPISADFYFCPNCGKQLRSKTISISIIKSVGVLLLSFFLPPLGLYPGIKYIAHGDIKTKIVGVLAVVITIVSIALTLYVFQSFMQEYTKTLDQITKGQYPGL